MKIGNKLHLLDEFQGELANYKPASETIEVLKKTPMLLLIGPTAAGRNTLINILIETNRYHQIVSHTTRNPRENNGVMEQNGVEYWFLSERDFLAGLRSGNYLEAAIIHGQQVSGIPATELVEAFNSGKVAIDEIEVEGASNIYSLKPDAVFIFLLPPAFEIWMSRLHGRGVMPESELTRRLKSAQVEIQRALEVEYYHFVINNDIHEAAMAVDELTGGRESDPHKQARGRDYAEQLLIDIQLYLDGK